MGRADLQDLIDNPRENLDLELKEWLVLSDGVVRANLARHICALANHGGGYLIFGFSDDLTPQPTPEDITAYNRDTFGSIVKKYLTPRVDCEVEIVLSSDGARRHAVVWVPGIKNVPVCAFADGPQNDKGRVQGINVGTHYMRASGPESTPIVTPDTWGAVIRRCVVNDRTELVETIEKLLHQREPTGPNKPELLEEWHQKSHERFTSLLPPDSDLDWPVPYGKHHFQLSYLVIHETGATVPADQLVALLNTVNHEVRELVWTGWSMFFPFTREPIRPYFVPENLSDGEVEVLETNLMADPSRQAGLPDFWRVSANGRASLVRPYFEDDPSVTAAHPGLEAASFFSPRLTARLLAEFVRHARALASRFETAESVGFECTWRGLAGRRIADLDWGTHWHDRVCKAGERTSRGLWPVGSLAGEWPEIVAALLSPVTVLFDGLNLPAKWVAELSKTFRM